MDLTAALDFVGSRRHGVLATQKRDGRPQLSNISYFVDGTGQIVISVTDGRAKTANIRREPRVSLHVARDDFYAYVVIDGDAALTPVAADPDDAVADALVDYSRAVAGEHQNWAEYRQAMVDDRRCLIRIVPSRGYGMLG